METNKREVEKYLSQPYARVLIPDSESGTYSAEILEFQGCVSEGDSPEGALANLEEAARAWIETCLETGKPVPRPAAETECSGKFALRLPKSLHEMATRLAAREGTSLNQFFVAAIAEKVGAQEFYERLVARFVEKAAEPMKHMAWAFDWIRVSDLVLTGFRERITHSVPDALTWTSSSTRTYLNREEGETRW